MLDPRQLTHLVERARDGDVEAFEDLVREHAARVYRTALRIVRDPQDAQDVAQRAFLSAWQGLGTFRGDAGFATWLHTIVRRHALNSLGRDPRHSWSALDSDPTDPVRGPGQQLLATETATTVRGAVADLPSGQGDVVRLFHFEHLSYAQIAAATDSSEPAVRSQLFRARRSLATALADQR